MALTKTYKQMLSITIARHILKDKIGKTIKLNQSSSIEKKVKTESVIRNINSFFMLIGLLG